ncbi:MAG: GDP-4-dehydro-6-deoxy-D-mannose reductase, partial [Thermoleophilales bacterium]|nr:GDP-4-dehydro-6-deoxy-D-mannose reductase [Thermoleophilales bacterium]
MRALITGAVGFVGGHLTDRLTTNGVEVTGPSRDELDLLDAEATRRAVAAIKPDAVFHLAALASVGDSWQAPAETFDNNTR